MFDVNLFANKKYSVHTHCSSSCSNNKLSLQCRVSARIEQPVNAAKKINTCAHTCAHSQTRTHTQTRSPSPNPPAASGPVKFLQVFLLLFCLSGLNPYLVSGELPQLWFIPMEMPSCATSECRHEWAVNLRLLPFVVTWLTCGFMIAQWEERRAFKANASFSKMFLPPTRAAGTWPLGFLVFIF